MPYHPSLTTPQSALLAQKAQDTVLFQDKCSVILLRIEYFLNITPFRKLKKFLALHSMLTQNKNALLRAYAGFFLLGKAKYLQLQTSVCVFNQLLQKIKLTCWNKRDLLISTNTKA